MTRPSLLAGALLVLCATLGLAAPAAPAAAAAPTAAPTERSQITFDRGEVATVVGDRFTLTSRITSPGTNGTAAPLIAHLDVVSRTTDVYVDPEDWSSERTVELDPADAEGGAQVAWDLQAVNAGRFAVYVVLLPTDGAAPLVVSPPVLVTVAGRRTLTPGHALPVTVAIPLLLGLATAAIRLRQRRS